MTQSLINRLNILEAGSVIDSDTKNKMLSVHDLLINNYKVDSTEENMERFLTHLAMAYTRIKTGQSISDGQNQGMEEVRSHPAYQKVLEISGKIKEILISLPPKEEEYVQVYVCMLLD